MRCEGSAARGPKGGHPASPGDERRRSGPNTLIAAASKQKVTVARRNVSSLRFWNPAPSQALGRPGAYRAVVPREPRPLHSPELVHGEVGLRGPELWRCRRPDAPSRWRSACFAGRVGCGACWQCGSPWLSGCVAAGGLVPSPGEGEVTNDASAGFAWWPCWLDLSRSASTTIAGGAHSEAAAYLDASVARSRADADCFVVDGSAVGRRLAWMRS